MDGGDKFVVGCLESDGEAQFRDHLGRIRADDVRAQDLAVRLADEQLDESFAFADGQAPCRWP